MVQSLIRISPSRRLDVIPGAENVIPNDIGNKNLVSEQSFKSPTSSRPSLRHAPAFQSKSVFDVSATSNNTSVEIAVRVKSKSRQGRRNSLNGDPAREASKRNQRDQLPSNPRDDFDRLWQALDRDAAVSPSRRSNSTRFLSPRKIERSPRFASSRRLSSPSANPRDDFDKQWQAMDNEAAMSPSGRSSSSRYSSPRKMERSPRFASSRRLSQSPSRRRLFLGKFFSRSQTKSKLSIDTSSTSVTHPLGFDDESDRCIEEAIFEQVKTAGAEDATASRPRLSPFLRRQRGAKCLHNASCASLFLPRDATEVLSRSEQQDNGENKVGSTENPTLGSVVCVSVVPEEEVFSSSEKEHVTDDIDESCLVTPKQPYASYDVELNAVSGLPDCGETYLLSDRWQENSSSDLTGSKKNISACRDQPTQADQAVSNDDLCYMGEYFAVQTEAHFGWEHSVQSYNSTTGPPLLRENSSHSSLYPPKQPKRGQEPVLVEVEPGRFMPLRGVEDVMSSIAAQRHIATQDCWSCQSVLHCVADAALVLCPHCRVAQQVERDVGSQEVQEGLALGFSTEDYIQMASGSSQ